MAAHRAISTLRSLGGWSLLLLATAIILAWLIGLGLSDRLRWTQWLSWLPSLALLPAGLLWLAGSQLLPMASHGRRLWPVGLVVMVVGPGLFLISNWRPSPMHERIEGLTLTQWTQGTVRADEAAYAQVLVDLDSDLTILEGGRRVRWEPSIQAWLGPDAPRPSTGIFSVLTRFPIDTLRSVLWADGMHAALLIVSGPGFEDRPLKLLLVDLPSDPTRSRWAMAARFGSLLASVDSIDIDDIDLIIGDFNMPTGSDALASMFPGFQPAWPHAGQGWGATFPRCWPVLRLDHVLVSERVRVRALRTIDPGVGRHRAQIMSVFPAAGEPN